MGINVKKFDLDLGEFGKQLDDESGIAIRKIGFEILRGIVLKSPVDTGRFRGNWNVSFNGPDESVVELEGESIPQGKEETKIAGEVLSKGATKIDGFKAGQNKSIHISNNLPYAARLENGYSKQAPAGMLDLTLAEISVHYANL